MLNGYVDVNVHDKLWAEIHLGIVNMEWTIILVEACYKGRLSYNTNIAKVREGEGGEMEGGRGRTVGKRERLGGEGERAEKN